MPKFMKRPIEIEAVQWTGDNITEISEFVGKDVDRVEGEKLYIDTLEGVMEAKKGWWIIRGIRGEFYPCENEIFNQTYMRVE